MTSVGELSINKFGRGNASDIDGIFMLACVGAPLTIVGYAVNKLNPMLSNISFYKEILANDQAFSFVVYTIFIVLYSIYMGIYYQLIWKEYFYTREHGYYFVIYQAYLVISSILFYSFFYNAVLIFTVCAFVPLYLIKRKTRVEYISAVSEFRDNHKISQDEWYLDVYHGEEKEFSKLVRKYQTLEALVNSFTKEFLRWGIFFFGGGAVVSYALFWYFKENFPVLKIAYLKPPVIIGDISMFVVLVGTWFLIVFLFFIFKIISGVYGIRSLIDRGQPAVFERKLSIFK
jgi:hypothetical protein